MIISPHVNLSFDFIIWDPVYVYLIGLEFGRLFSRCPESFQGVFLTTIF